MIEDKDIKWLASLSRLEFPDKEIAKLKTDLNKILGFVNMLNELDTEMIEPKHSVSGVKGVLRKDAVTRDQSFKDKLLEAAPDADTGYIRVKAVQEEWE